MLNDKMLSTSSACLQNNNLTNDLRLDHRRLLLPEESNIRAYLSCLILALENIGSSIEALVALYCSCSFKRSHQTLLEYALLDFTFTAGNLPPTKLGGKEFQTL